jgi:hypothetical protein
MGETGRQEQPAPPAADSGGSKKPASSNNDDERKPYRGRRHRGRNNKQQWKEGGSAPIHVAKEKFLGRSEDLKGFIYDITSSKGGVAYTRTTEEIARYVGEKYTTTGSYIRTGILTLNVPTPVRPTAPVATGTPATVNLVDQEIFKEKIRMYVKIESAVETTMKSLYDLIWGQCSESLRSRLRGHDDYATYSPGADSIALLKGIRAEMTGFRDKQYLPHALHKIMQDFYNLAQGKHRNNQEYYDEFNSMVLTAKESGATIGAHPAAITDELDTSAADSKNPTLDEQIMAGKIATDRYLAVAFLLGADKTRYGTLVEEIENEYLRNKGSSTKAGTYPTSVAEAYDYLCNYKKDPKNLTRLLGHNPGGDNLNTGVVFAQDGAKDESNNISQEQAFATTGGAGNNANRGNNKKTCRRCGTDGHTSIECNSGSDKVESYRQSQQPNQGVSQLIHAVSWDGVNNATDDDAINWTFLVNDVFKHDAPVQCTEHHKNGSISQVHKSTIFSQANSGIPSTWYLLDNQSTCDIVSNPRLVKNIRQVEGYMQLATQAGSTTTNWMADVPGYYRPVWFHPGGIANILSLVNMIAKYHVTYDSRAGDNPNEFCVHKADGSTRRFKQSRRGLFYHDTAEPEQHTVLTVSTVETNRTKYADRDYSRAILARKVQVLVGRPELKDFLRYIEGKSLRNCPITRQDAVNAHAILGRDLGSIKGKTTRRSIKGILRSVANNIPKSILSQYRDITLCIDIMFVNRIPFFMSMSRNLRFITCEVLDNREQASLIKALQRINGIYRKRGFRITLVLGDSEFECTRGAIATDLKSELNICGEDEHIPDIERCIRTTKERTRCTYNMSPFDHYPPRMVIEMVFLSVFWINAFPHRLGVSQTLSPRTIVTGLEVDYTKHCRIEYGQYVQTHEKHDNTMRARTVGAIALRPTGNQQGGYYFYSLLSGRRLHRTHWTELPMPAEAKDRVHALARRANARRGLTFTDSHNNDLDELYPDGTDDDDDSDYDPDESSDASSTSSDDSDPSDHNSLDDDSVDAHLPDPRPDTPRGIAGVDNTPAGVDNTTAGVDDVNNIPEETPGVDTPGAEADADVAIPPPDGNADATDANTGAHDADTGANDTDTDPQTLEAYVDELEAELNDEIADIHSTYDPNDGSDDESSDDESEKAQDDAPSSRLRRNRTPSYGHLKGRAGDGSLPTIARPDEFKGGRHQSHVILQSIIMTQYNLKQGIKKFGDKGKEAVLTELQQLHDRAVMAPINKYDLTPSERKGALRYLMFLKEKRDETIKGRGCADGRPQREYMSKKETSSPTVATEALLLTCVIDAIEGRDVATLDIPGAFMQSDMEGKVIMKLEGVMAEIILKIDPKLYKKFITQENGKDVIYVLLKKALYGTLQAALLFWQNLSGQLKKWGFEINPYDFCVANKNINGKQCTIVWHVDDLKISHVDASVVTTIINLLDAKYGQEIVGGKRAPVTVTRGKIHDYLGMTLDYTEDGVFKLDMTEYIKKIHDEMPEDMDGTATSPAAAYLFHIDENVENLDEATSEFFHATVAKLLFLCKRARPDIQTAVAFLCTRVQQPTRHDYNKLARVIKYLRGTRDLVLRLSADNLNIIKWWVDAAYGVHHDMRSHTGGVMSLGTGAAYATSNKQKLNTKSSTEAELVGIDDVLPQALWTKYFMEAQGYGVTTILNQDNQSTIKLSENGKSSSGKGTRHINIRYFFITDRIARKEVAIQYCPTKEMVADYFTKPLQGELFYKFRDQIMGVVPMNTITGDHRSVLDDESTHPISSEKPSTVSPKVPTSAPPKRAAFTSPTTTQSWADVVKSKPHDVSIARLKRLKRRAAHTFSLI